MAWLSQLGEWFGWRSRQPELDELGSAKETLRAEQRELGREIETLFQTYDDRLQELALKAHALSREEFEHESEQIRSAQEHLRHALRRLDASVRTTEQLKRELEDWERRKEKSPSNADRSDIRAEIIRSELTVRGVVRSASPEFVADVIQRQQDARRTKIVEEASDVDEAVVETEQTEQPQEYVFVQTDAVPSTDTLYLIRAIREATREAERWHAIPSEAVDEEALLQVKHLRELHAALKQADREQGIERDRMELAVSARGLH